MNEDRDYLPFVEVAYAWYQTWIPRIDGYTCVHHKRYYAAAPGMAVPREVRHGIHGLPFVYSYETVLFQLGVN